MCYESSQQTWQWLSGSDLSTGFGYRISKARKEGFYSVKIQRLVNYQLDEIRNYAEQHIDNAATLGGVFSGLFELLANVNSNTFK